MVDWSVSPKGKARELGPASSVILWFCMTLIKYPQVFIYLQVNVAWNLRLPDYTNAHSASPWDAEIKDKHLKSCYDEHSISWIPINFPSISLNYILALKFSFQVSGVSDHGTEEREITSSETPWAESLPETLSWTETQQIPRFVCLGPSSSRIIQLHCCWCTGNTLPRFNINIAIIQ